MAGIERVCISVNSVCNLKCTYCYFFLEPDRLPGPEALSADDISVILENVSRYAQRPEVDKSIKVNFVGSGEPLLAWRNIRTAIEQLNSATPGHRLRFYTVTNGLLLTPRIVKEMQAISLSPSVSVDGPAWLHDRTRLTHAGRGSHAQVMRGLEALRSAGVPIAINTTLRGDVIANLDAVFDFLEEERIPKVIFDRLVDVPAEHAVSDAEFYEALRRIVELHDARRIAGLEVGNLEAYRRALAGKPDRVCTMFGSTCGSGFHNIIYMQRDVYPCGRMFGQDQWKLGRFDEPLENFPRRMSAIVGAAGCDDHATPDNRAGPDCLIERGRADYDPMPRLVFVNWLGKRLDSP